MTDNTDLMLLREGLQMLAGRMVGVIDALARSPRRHRDLPCLGFTHLQPAQPTTVGKRACLWAYDFVLDLAEIEHRLASLKALGIKGTTGTQASFLELFRRRPRQGPPLEDADLPQDRLRRSLSRHRANLLAEDRLRRCSAPCRRGPERPQDGHRPAAAGPSQGTGRTLRDGPGRLLGDGLQAEPDAVASGFARWPGS